VLLANDVCKRIEKEDCAMNYKERFNKVIDFIGQHLDEELSIDQLSTIACFSKFHFHRLFTVYTGLSLKKYVKWLRLKRAAYQLVINQDTSIIEIAMNAGYESHEAFSRAFKSSLGQAPREFRIQAELPDLNPPQRSLPPNGDIQMRVTIQERKKQRLAAVEHRGNPQDLPMSIVKLITWAKAQTVNLKPKPGMSFGIAYDDPNAVEPEAFRFDLGLAVPDDFIFDPKEDKVIESVLPSGEYAVAEHQGSRENLADTTYPLYQWVQEKGYELGNFPCLFSYDNFEHEVAETELKTQVMVLLKS
jgi:AraC family transcriptional regulator